MADIVERLRAWADHDDPNALLEAASADLDAAASKIEYLRATIHVLEKQVQTLQNELFRRALIEPPAALELSNPVKPKTK